MLKSRYVHVLSSRCWQSSSSNPNIRTIPSLFPSATVSYTSHNNTDHQGRVILLPLIPPLRPGVPRLLHENNSSLASPAPTRTLTTQSDGCTSCEHECSCREPGTKWIGQTPQVKDTCTCITCGCGYLLRIARASERGEYRCDEDGSEIKRV